LSEWLPDGPTHFISITNPFDYSDNEAIQSPYSKSNFPTFFEAKFNSNLSAFLPADFVPFKLSEWATYWFSYHSAFRGPH
jgi:hypothetical protein